MPFDVKDLIDGKRAPVSITRNRSVVDAIRLMIDHEFSQLPVLDGEGCPVGMISFDSILHASSTFAVPAESMRVAEAMSTRARKFGIDDSIDDLLDDLRDAYAVLICDDQDRLIAIVTSFDTTEYFRRRAQDMMMIGDIEALVKEFIRAAFAAKEGSPEPPELMRVIADTAPEREHARKAARILGKYGSSQGTQTTIDRAVLGKLIDEEYSLTSKPLEKLALQQFIDILLHEERWLGLQPLFGVEKSALRRVLERVRESRNNLAHFRAALSEDERRHVQFTLNWVKGLRVEFLGHFGAPKHPTTTQAAAPAVPKGELRLRRLGRPGRYAPLGDWLRGQPRDTNAVEATFRQIEDLVGTLPTSARQHYAWWANDRMSHSQSRQWLAAGWIMSGVDLDTETVSFERIPEHALKYRRFYDPVLPILRQRLQWSSPIKTLHTRDEDWWIEGFRPSGQPADIIIGYDGVSLMVAFVDNPQVRVRLEQLKAFEPEILRRAPCDVVDWDVREDGLWATFWRKLDLDGTPDELQQGREWLVELVSTVVDICDTELNSKSGNQG